MGNWVAHRNILWNPQTWYPVARVVADITGMTLFIGVTDQTFQNLCDGDSRDRASIVRVEDYTHGGLAILQLSTDGRTLLWSVIQYPDDQSIPRLSASGIAQDVVAYATDIQSGDTTQNLPLHLTIACCQQLPRPHGRPMGRTLALGIQDETSTEIPQPFFVMLATVHQLVQQPLSPRHCSQVFQMIFDPRDVALAQRQRSDARFACANRHAVDDHHRDNPAAAAGDERLL